MTLLFILFGLFLGFWLFTGHKSEPSKSLCKLHKWVYNNQDTDEEYMVCSVCNRRPGQAIDDGSEL